MLSSRIGCQIHVLTVCFQEMAPELLSNELKAHRKITHLARFGVSFGKHLSARMEIRWLKK